MLTYLPSEDQTSASASWRRNRSSHLNYWKRDHRTNSTWKGRDRSIVVEGELHQHPAIGLHRASGQHDNGRSRRLNQQSPRSYGEWLFRIRHTRTMDRLCIVGSLLSFSSDDLSKLRQSTGKEPKSPPASFGFPTPTHVRPIGGRQFSPLCGH